MVQIARPDQDISDGSWTAEGVPTDLFDTINEVSPDDNDFMEDAGNNTTAEIGLETVDVPGVATGHIIRFRMKSEGKQSPERCNVQLFEGTNLRAETGNQISRGSFGDKDYTLSEAESDSITAYNDLRFKIISSNLGGTETMQVSFAEFEVPDVATTSIGHPQLIAPHSI